MKIEEVRSKRDSELEYDLAQLKKELFGLRFKGATETSASPSRIREVRRLIARMQTIRNERKHKIRGQEPR
jgi:large subunit ribosomal protein L29